MTEKHKHKDAFMIMKFKCVSCNHFFTIWNSRDGKSLFEIDCTQCKEKYSAIHVEEYNDIYNPNYEPHNNDLVIISWKMEELLEIIQRGLVKKGPLDVTGAANHASYLISQEFDGGPPPKLITVEEWREYVK